MLSGRRAFRIDVRLEAADAVLDAESALVEVEGRGI
jgi:hypothetical protein